MVEVLGHTIRTLPPPIHTVLVRSCQVTAGPERPTGIGPLPTTAGRGPPLAPSHSTRDNRTVFV